MGSDTSSPAPASPCSKRSRDPEDEVYLDNLHSHKRYLSEIMASSLNGLTVGDHPLPDNLMDSPARSDSLFYIRDDMSLQYSPMSEDSDDSRNYETPSYTCSPQRESSRPTSPVSPYRNQRPCPNFPTTHVSYGCALLPPVPSSTQQARQRGGGGSESEGRFPSSPSDICHSADLRRAALLRSVQMRTTQPTGSMLFESTSSSSQEESCSSCMKSLVVDDRDYQLEECSAVLDNNNNNNNNTAESETVILEKPCQTCNTNMKSQDPEP